jgi:hypothetical protein
MAALSTCDGSRSWCRPPACRAWQLAKSPTMIPLRTGGDGGDVALGALGVRTAFTAPKAYISVSWHLPILAPVAIELDGMYDAGASPQCKHDCPAPPGYLGHAPSGANGPRRNMDLPFARCVCRSARRGCKHHGCERGHYPVASGWKATNCANESQTIPTAQSPPSSEEKP